MRRSTTLFAAASLVLALSPLATQAAHATTGPAAQVIPLGVGVIPYDFNGDGYAEIVAGVPGEDIGGGTAKIVDAGVITVIPGSATGPVYAGAVEWSQDTGGVKGVSEKGDFFGIYHVSGDFNADGYADLAIGSPFEDAGSSTDTGSVTVLYGSALGLSTVQTRTESLDEAPYANVGSSLATGDFDGDGSDELVVGARGAQAVYVVPRLPGFGLDFVSASRFSDANLPGSVHADAFGASVAVGDVNGDGNLDLAVGDPFDYDFYGYSTGAVTLIKGTANGSGLTTTGATRWTVDSPGIKGTAHSYSGKGSDQLCDCFGYAVALGDINADGFDDLVVSAPGTPVVHAGASRQDAGEFHVIPGSISGLTDVGDLLINEESPGIPGIPATGDTLGTTLTLDDMDSDGDADLAVAVPGEEGFLLVAGATTGFGTVATTWNQDSPGVPGTRESGDYFGDFMRWVAVDGTPFKSLIVGAEGEDSLAGSVWVIKAGPGALTSAGISTFNQDTPGVPGLREAGDLFGTV